MQNSPNKTRNYDTNPLILRDYTTQMRVHNLLNIVSFFVLYIYMDFCRSDTDYSVLILRTALIFMVFMAVDLFLFFVFSSDKNFMILYNSCILIYKNNILKREFEFDKNSKLELQSFICKIKKYGKLYYKIFIIAIIIRILKYEDEIFAIIVTIAISFILGILYDILVRMVIYICSNQTLLEFFRHCNKFQIKISLVKDQKNKFHEGVCLFFFNQNDYENLKNYISEIFNQNLDKDIN